MVHSGLKLTVCCTFSLFLMHPNTSYRLDLLPEGQAFLTKLACGQGAGKSTSAMRDKPEMAFVLHTWGGGLSLLMAATGFRSLKTSPLCWGEALWLQSSRPDVTAVYCRLNSALFCLTISPVDTQQLEVVSIP